LRKPVDNTDNSETDQVDILFGVRSQLLKGMLIALTLLGLPVVVTSCIEAIKFGQFGGAILIIGLYLLVAITTIYFNRLPFVFCAVVMLASLYMIAVSNLLHFSFSGAVISISLTISVLATVLFGRRSGFITAAICLITFIAIGLCFVYGVIDVNPEMAATTTEAVSWMAAAAIFALLSCLVILSCGRLQGHLINSMESLRYKTEELKTANKNLILEIEHRKMADTKLRGSEKHLRSLMKSATNFVVYRLVPDKTNPHQLKVKFVSPSIKDILGVPEPMKFETWFKSMHSEDVERIADANLQAFKTHKFDEEYRTYNHKKDEWIWIHAISTGVVDKKGTVTSVNGILFDVTDRKQVEILLQESEKQLKTLNNYIILTEERERSTLATNLHDTVAQTLALSVSKIKNLKESVAVNDVEMLSAIQELIEQSIQEVRQQINQLCPPVIKDFDIGTAIGFLVEEINEEYHTDITYINNFDGLLHIDEPIKITLYRAVSELITNINKHSGVKEAKVDLSQNKNFILLKIEDYGVGFDMTSIKTSNSQGFGLYGLSERCNNVGGEFKIESTPGKGTKATLYMPIK
jgi:signal transduction histidine kinase